MGQKEEAKERERERKGQSYKHIFSNDYLAAKGGGGGRMKHKWDGK